jgi:hypothetical protein
MWLAAPLVAEARRDRAVHRERIVAESQLQLPERVGPLVRAVRHRHEVGDGQVAAAIGGVGGG